MLRLLDTIVILGVLSFRFDMLQKKITHFSYYKFYFNLFLHY